MICLIPVSAQKYWNTALKLDGKSYLSVAENVLKEARPKLTVEFWIKPDVDSAGVTVMGNTQFWILLDKGRVRLQGNGGTALIGKGRIKGNIWTHVAAVYDGTGSKKAIIYINGQLDSSTAFTNALLSTTDSFYIGKKYFSQFSGELDDIRIWRVARTADEIQKNARTHMGGPYTDDIFGYGELAYVQSFESPMADSGLYVSNARFTGNVKGVSRGLTPSPLVRHNNSVYMYGGAYAYLQALTANDPGVSFSGNMTVEAWIHPTAYDTRMMIVDMTGGVNGGGFELFTAADGKLGFTIEPQSAYAPSVMLPNQWHHVAVVVDSTSQVSSTARMYINGKLVSTSNHNKLTRNIDKLRIGASHSNSDYFKGYMDEVRISNYAKSEAEILANMYTPITKNNMPVAPKTTAAYNFDGGFYSSTGIGPRLENENSNCRFSYYNEPASPLFSMGSNHATHMSKFRTVQRAAFVPAYGNTMGVITDTLVFEKAVKINPNAFKVFLSLAHANFQDLKVELISPTGETVEIFNQLTGISGNVIAAVIDTQQMYKLTSSAWTDHSPRVGFNGNFAAYNGKNSKGVWTLKVSDLYAGYTGRLYSWGIYADGELIQQNGVYSQQKNMFSIYPNPLGKSNEFSIRSATEIPESSKVTIADLNGRVVMDSRIVSANGLYNIRLNKSLQAGSYIVRIQNAQGEQSAVLCVTGNE
ncbi:MAG: proprotein convertase P-domain-containing protein [Bacteroidetes bacterium]|nr:proprotein convertase P-domain-containing protein [Bacteroidota bacterium]